ncbi:NAD(P)-binding protein [Phlyctochytrium arcticum]|nr:NAD(P)-binding protein [Phlyctochytrium arcticum]
MNLGLEDTHVLMTGASGGVGLATAKQFLDAGAKVTLQYNTSLEPLEPLLKAYPTKAVALKADLTSEDGTKRLFAAAKEKFGTVDTLIVLHGIWPSVDVSVKDMPLERWKNTMSVNLDGTFLACKYYLQGIELAVKQGEQLRNVAIVFVGSTAGKYGEAMHADYACSKSAIMTGLTLSLKNEIVKTHPRGRVNTVSPGWIRTPMAERAMQDPNLLYEALASSPLNKVSEPTDVSNAILFLASENASGNITGISLDVNAGMEGRLLNNKP